MDGWMDRQTDRHDELIVTFHSFANAPKKLRVFNKKQDNEKAKHMCHLNNALPSQTFRHISHQT
jgi:hypothetical protein